MRAALYDEQDGYYCRPHLIRQGRAGDYRTAPETSSLFAATFANYFAGLFHELGAPDPFTIVEVGAGSGEFALGVLNSLKSHNPDVFDSTKYVVEEIGPASRRDTSTLLSQFKDRISITSPSLSGIGAQRGGGFTGIIFSNELIDAFPVHRVVMRQGSISELCVTCEGERFVWTDCEPGAAVKTHLESTSPALTNGQIAEINLEAENFVSRAAALLERGFLITVDYGAERQELLHDPQRFFGTLRGFQRHQIIEDVLTSPGEVDITTTIDWTQLKLAGEPAGLRVMRHEPLDKFLLAEGLLDELERLTGSSDEAAAIRLRIGAREMIMPNGLAASFQVLVQQKNNVSEARS
jgi:SAM-dependent MidA family methyltransferase